MAVAAAVTRGVFAPTHRALTVGILLTVTAIAFEGMAVATVLPAVAADLAGLDGYGWAFSAFMLSSLVGAISAGQIADQRDPGLPASVGFACFSVGLVLAGLAPSWPIFLAGRSLQGFGAGSLSATAFVAIARGYPERLRPRLMALLSSAWIVPALIGPALAGQVAEHASWRLVFVGLLPPMPAGAWMLLPALARLPRSADDSADPPVPSDHTAAASSASVGGAPLRRVFDALRLAAGVGLLLLAAGLQELVTVLIVGGLGLVLAAPALRDLLPPGTLSGRTGQPAAVALRALLAFGFFGSEALIPLGLSTQRRLPPSLVGISLTAGALAWVAGSWMQDRAESWSSGSLPQRAVRAAVGLLLIAAGIGGVAAVILNSNLPVEFVVIAWAVAGLGMGLAYPASTLTALGLAPSGQEGSAAAALQVAETVGIAAGAGAVGTLLAIADHFQHAMSDGLAWGFLLGVLSIIAALAPAVRLTPRLQLVARVRGHDVHPDVRRIARIP